MIEGTIRLAPREGGEVGITAAVYAQQRFSAEGRRGVQPVGLMALGWHEEARRMRSWSENEIASGWLCLSRGVFLLSWQIFNEFVQYEYCGTIRNNSDGEVRNEGI